MYESMMMIVMWIMGLFGGMIYKHFQVNKLRGEVKRYKAESKHYKGQVYHLEQDADNLVDEILKYKHYIKEEFGREVVFREGGTETTFIEKEGK